ncbi:hypothetical protein VaNZ11_008899 [Volvox africanus]|uniref:SET domain-containing protein n=1 Tax=Volvox africanus TaxID=51714 RepID=A0ABQ5S661_9CHLO|nr:hypothetical protein VaNZ11_008899 [Volvox africanus]
MSHAKTAPLQGSLGVDPSCTHYARHASFSATHPSARCSIPVKAGSQVASTHNPQGHNPVVTRPFRFTFFGIGAYRKSPYSSALTRFRFHFFDGLFLTIYLYVIIFSFCSARSCGPMSQGSSGPYEPFLRVCNNPAHNQGIPLSQARTLSELRKIYAMAGRSCARRQIAISDRRLLSLYSSLHKSSRCFIARQYEKFNPFHSIMSNVFNISGKSFRNAIPGTALQSTVSETPTSLATEGSNDEESDLHDFISWLVANGVKGIGQEGSKVALFQSANGERGLVCEELISKGDMVLEVPLRLALTDHPGDAESNQLLYPGAPWSVRLACKLLRHLAAGKRSPWAPYIKVLPRCVPAPLESFSWEDISALRYPTAQEALHSADWLRADALTATSEEARGGLGEEAFRWALSVRRSASVWVSERVGQ